MQRNDMNLERNGKDSGKNLESKKINEDLLLFKNGFLLKKS
jgi:hypothetical protein